MLLFQATELADLTSKISLLEDAKKKKEEEANQWQQKVWSVFIMTTNHFPLIEVTCLFPSLSYWSRFLHIFIKWPVSIVWTQKAQY